MENAQINDTDTNLINIGAGFWIRALARLIDITYGWVFMYFSGFFGGIILYILSTYQIVNSNWYEGTSIAVPTLSLMGSFAYRSFCEGLHGATLGKLICGLRVLSDDGNTCNLKAAVIRTIAFLVDALFFGLVAYVSMSRTDLNQRYGDRWAKTIVVGRSQVPERSKRSGLTFMLAFLVGSIIWGALIILSLMLKAFRLIT